MLDKFKFNFFLQNNKLFVLLSSLFFTYIFFYLILANSDLIEGFHVLFIDERLSFNETKEILYSEGIINFIENIIFTDVRYGSIFWNINAFFAFIPEKIFGDKGIIITQRFLLIFFVFGSYIVIAHKILKNPITRLSLLICMSSIPYAYYYMTMPKPEPLQLFFITFFIYYFLKIMEHSLDIGSLQD